MRLEAQHTRGVDSINREQLSGVNVWPEYAKLDGLAQPWASVAAQQEEQTTEKGKKKEDKPSADMYRNRLGRSLGRLSFGRVLQRIHSLAHLQTHNTSSTSVHVDINLSWAVVSFSFSFSLYRGCVRGGYTGCRPSGRQEDQER